MRRQRKLPFRERIVYYSGSITGVAEADPEFPELLVNYIQRGGAHVLDPHVAISRTLKPDAFVEALAASHGITVTEWNSLDGDEQNVRIYTHDISFVNQATHVVTLLNGASTGVGMELQQALLKPHLGLPITPILGLVHASRFAALSPMIKGAVGQHPAFVLEIYGSLDDAQGAICRFLTS
jgi:hypothetical protein